MRTRLAIALVLATPIVAMAQRISGTVRAAGTSAPLSDAIVTVLDSVNAAIAQGRTDQLGKYDIPLMPDGRRIRTTHIGYRPAVLNIPSGTGDVIMDVVMEVGRELDTVVTKAPEERYQVPRLQDFERRRKNNVGGRFIAEDDLRKLERVSMPSILRSRLPGLRIMQCRGQHFASSTSAPGHQQEACPPRGPRGCWVAVYVDGLMIFDRLQPNARENPPDVGQFFAMNLSGIEYYSNASSTPLQFKTLQNNCGTLLFWTRGR